MRTARVGLAIADQRPLKRRSREDSCRDRPNSGQSISLRVGIGSFSVSVPDATCNANGNDDRSAHLHQARTPVFGHGARTSMLIGASLLKLAPRGSAAVALDLPLRGRVSRINAPQAALFSENVSAVRLLTAAQLLSGSKHPARWAISRSLQCIIRSLNRSPALARQLLLRCSNTE